MSLPAIVLSNLTWKTPDGTPVLSDVSISFAPERSGIVGRNGVGKSTLLGLILGRHQPASGTVRVSGTVAALRQIVQVSGTETIADLMGVAQDLDLLDKAASGTATADELTDADWTLEGRIADALGQMGLSLSPRTPLAEISGGQRTRAALASAILAKPDFLLLDEPTNDLDAAGRGAVVDLLRGWRAGALVVSHDRTLLEEMDAIVELTTLGLSRYGGNWTVYRTRKDVELEAARRDLAAAERRADQVDRKVQEAFERKQRRDAAGARSGASGSLPRILAGARRDRAQKSGGESARAATRRRDEASSAVDTVAERVERLEQLNLTLEPTGLAPDREVVEVANLEFGYGRAGAVLSGMSFEMRGPERVSISGSNGAGKSTLLAILAGRLAPSSGTVRLRVPFAMLDQRVSLLDPNLSLVENFRAFNRTATDNESRAALARFGFRNESAERTVRTLSGGQTLRAGLACCLGGLAPPQLLILDEPTNHLDLDSQSAIEAALKAFDGALLVVSHDAHFIDAVGISRRLELRDGALFEVG